MLPRRPVRPWLRRHLVRRRLVVSRLLVRGQHEEFLPVGGSGRELDFFFCCKLSFILSPFGGGAVEAASMGPLVHCRSVRCMPIQGSWAGVDALPCCAAAAKAEEAAAVVSDDVTTAGRCSDFTAVSKLPLVHCPVAASKYDTGSATGCKRQPS